MKKCKCVKKLVFFVIDDSFDDNSSIKSGPLEFDVDTIYNFELMNSYFGSSYVLNNNGSKFGLDEAKFNLYFEEI